MDKQRKKELLQSYKAQTSVGGVYAITNIVTGKRILSFTMDLKGSRNRFEFAQQMNSCVHPQLQDDWARLGGHSFRFDVLESLTQKEGQSDSDFRDELKALFDIISAGASPDRYETTL
jgi:hypothetical protein